MAIRQLATITQMVTGKLYQRINIIEKKFDACITN